jgi:hypothetical protein
METKHSKKPWIADYRLDQNDLCEMDEPISIDAGDGAIVIMPKIDVCPSSGVLRAYLCIPNENDLTLIESAPDLLGACQELLDYIETNVTHMPCINKAMRIIGKAKSAISKAASK